MSILQVPIREIFERSLFRMLMQHLFLDDHPLFGLRLYIKPWNSDTLMKIRWTLYLVEGEHVFDLNYWGILELFEAYCKHCYPIYYDMKEQGLEEVIYL